DDASNFACLFGPHQKGSRHAFARPRKLEPLGPPPGATSRGTKNVTSGRVSAPRRHGRKAMVRSHRFGKKLAAFAAFAAFLGTPAFPQTVNLADGPVDVVLRSGLPIDLKSGQGPALSDTVPPAGISTASSGLAFYSANYTSLGGKQLPFNIVGTDPSLGAN